MTYKEEKKASHLRKLHIEFLFLNIENRVSIWSLLGTLGISVKCYKNKKPSYKGDISDQSHSIIRHNNIKIPKHSGKKVFLSQKTNVKS